MEHCSRCRADAVVLFGQHNATEIQSEENRSANTIAGYLAHLRSALRWAVTMEMLPSLPEIRKPKRATTSKVMKGRPITQEEFERMLAKAEKIVGTNATASWKYYLEGL
jgi:hypothetical protein